MTNVDLVLQLAITGLTHALELQTLVATAVAEGRDLTDAEMAASRAKRDAAIADYDAKVKGMTP